MAHSRARTRRRTRLVTAVGALAVIPARGGSRGIPRKNLLQLAGKPLVGWAVEACLQSQSVSRVVVSTDDADIATAAKQYGAEVVVRPAELSGDSASSESALLHALDMLREVEGYEPEILVFAQCTSPLTLPADVDGTVASLLSARADSAFTATPFHGFVWQRDALGDAHALNHNPSTREPRQARDGHYIETGAVYAMRASGFRSAGSRFFGKVVFHVTPPERSVDIDGPLDVVLAEALLRERRS